MSLADLDLLKDPTAVAEYLESFPHLKEEIYTTDDGTASPFLLSLKHKFYNTTLYLITLCPPPSELYLIHHTLSAYADDIAKLREIYSKIVPYRSYPTTFLFWSILNSQYTKNRLSEVIHSPKVPYLVDILFESYDTRFRALSLLEGPKEFDKYFLFFPTPLSQAIYQAILNDTFTPPHELFSLQTPSDELFVEQRDRRHTSVPLTYKDLSQVLADPIPQDHSNEIYLELYYEHAEEISTSIDRMDRSLFHIAAWKRNVPALVFLLQCLMRAYCADVSMLVGDSHPQHYHYLSQKYNVLNHPDDDGCTVLHLCTSALSPAYHDEAINQGLALLEELTYFNNHFTNCTLNNHNTPAEDCESTGIYDTYPVRMEGYAEAFLHPKTIQLENRHGDGSLSPQNSMTSTTSGSLHPQPHGTHPSSNREHPPTPSQQSFPPQQLTRRHPFTPITYRGSALKLIIPPLNPSLRLVYDYYTPLHLALGARFVLPHDIAEPQPENPLYAIYVAILHHLFQFHYQCGIQPDFHSSNPQYSYSIPLCMAYFKSCFPHLAVMRVMAQYGCVFSYHIADILYNIVRQVVAPIPLPDPSHRVTNAKSVIDFLLEQHTGSFVELFSREFELPRGTMMGTLMHIWVWNVKYHPTSPMGIALSDWDEYCATKLDYILSRIVDEVAASDAHDETILFPNPPPNAQHHDDHSTTSPSSPTTHPLSTTRSPRI